MNVLSKGVRSLRIIALPLARIKNSPDTNTNALLVFYHFDLAPPCAVRSKDLPWHKKMLENVTNKAMDLWTGLGKAPKGSWKLWTYELGERMADKIEFEELVLRNVDPSLGPTIPTGTIAESVNDAKKDWRPSHSLPKIPLIYPPSLYPVGANGALQPPLAHLQTLLASRAPRHRRGFYLWMLVVPLTVPITLIPIIPNFPFFFCVWRSWSHYRAYRTSRYLSSLLDHGLIEPHPSLELDKLYASSTSTSRSLPSATLASTSSEKTSTFGNVAADRKSEAAPRTGASQSERILLTREAMPQILEMFHLPGSDMHRAMNQAHDRLGKSP